MSGHGGYGGGDWDEEKADALELERLRGAEAERRHQAWCKKQFPEVPLAPVGQPVTLEDAQQVNELLDRTIEAYVGWHVGLDVAGPLTRLRRVLERQAPQRLADAWAKERQRYNEWLKRQGL
jgi:hypothetical protein